MTRKYQVRVTREAEDDIFDTFGYVREADGSNKAEHLLSKLQQSCAGLATLPHRGHVPPELDRIGVLEYLEIHFKPYRIIYQVTGSQVHIHCVFDGRRDLQSVLQRRLLR